MSSTRRPPAGRSRTSRAVAAALTLVLGAVAVVTVSGVLALAVLRGPAAPPAAAAVDPPGGAAAGVATADGPGPEQPARTRPALPDLAPRVDAEPLLAAVDAAAGAAGGAIDLVVLAADGTPLVTGPGAGEAVYTASLVKLLVVGRLLALEAIGAVVLTDRDRSLMERAVVRSDDGAMNLLWDRWDGAALVTGLAADAGLTGTGLPDVAGRWGEATTTATDVAVLLARLDDVLGDGPAGTLRAWMRATSATAADGFGQDFGLLAGQPAGTVAAKQGWMCCAGGTRQLHSAGVLPGGEVVVLLGDFPAGTSWSRARAALDTAAATVRTAMG